MLKPLPIGLSTLRDLIQGGYLYIDKTKWIYDLVRYPKGLYFLSRPRRFGKSLMVSTLEAIFLGNRDLFKGLSIDQTDYQWQVHPVIRIDFSHTDWQKGITIDLECIANQYIFIFKYHK